MNHSPLAVPRRAGRRTGVIVLLSCAGVLAVVALTGCGSSMTTAPDIQPLMAATDGKPPVTRSPAGPVGGGTVIHKPQVTPVAPAAGDH
jgi:hypothetical protein